MRKVLATVILAISMAVASSATAANAPDPVHQYGVTPTPFQCCYVPSLRPNPVHQYGKVPKPVHQYGKGNPVHQYGKAIRGFRLNRIANPVSCCRAEV
jgi:hypothetical protein